LVSAPRSPRGHSVTPLRGCRAQRSRASRRRRPSRASPSNRRSLLPSFAGPVYWERKGSMSNTVVPRSGESARAFWKPERVGQAVRSGALLAVLGASLPLLFVEVAGRKRWLDPFLAQNKLPLGQRHLLLDAMVGTAIVFAVAAW